MGRARRRSNSLLSIDPATDLLSCGLGAALLLFAVFLANVVPASEKEDTLVLVSVAVDSLYKADTLIPGGTFWGGAQTCVVLELDGEEAVESCGQLSSTELKFPLKTLPKVHWTACNSIDSDLQVACSGAGTNRIQFTALKAINDADSVAVRFEYRQNDICEAAASCIPIPEKDGIPSLEWVFHFVQKRFPSTLELSVQNLSEDQPREASIQPLEYDRRLERGQRYKHLGFIHSSCSPPFDMKGISGCFDGNRNNVLGTQEKHWYRNIPQTDYRFRLSSNGLNVENMETGQKQLWK